MLKRRVLITGASRGIGAELARSFAARGFSVLINYNQSEKKAESLRKEITDKGGSAEIFGCDVSKPEQVKEMMGFAIELFGGLDVLINNAGISHYGLLTEVKDSEWRRLLDVNLGGVFFTTRAALPGMISAKSGCIVNISSVHGILGASCETAYSAVKAGIVGFTKALSREVGLSGIRVNCIAPGVINTDMNSAFSGAELEAMKERTSLNALGHPSDVASAALFLASDEARYITGQVLAVDGGWL